MLLEKSFTLVVIIIVVVVAVVVGERRKAPEGEITITITTTIKSSFHCVFITFFRFYFWFWPKHFIQLLAAPLDFSFFIYHFSSTKPITNKSDKIENNNENVQNNGKTPRQKITQRTNLFSTAIEDESESVNFTFFGGLVLMEKRRKILMEKQSILLQN